MPPALTLAQEDPDTALTTAAGRIRHFHVSEKDLAPVGTGSVEHARFAAALRAAKYPNWISVEMRAAPEGNNLPQIQKSLDILQSVYG